MLAAPKSNNPVTPARALAGAVARPGALAPVRAEAVALVFAGVLALMLSLPSVTLKDPDTFWHIAVGRHIWATGAMVRVDTFSHTFAGAPWPSTEWLAQLPLYGAYAAAGWTGVAALAALAMASLCALLFAALLRQVRLVVALALTAAVFGLMAQMPSARPQLFAASFMVPWICGLVRAVEDGRRPSWWLVLLMALWANVHASFPVALVFTACLGAEAVILAPQGRRGALLTGWAAFGLAALAATMLTPYGIRSILFPLQVMNGNEAVPYIAEWRATEPGVRMGIAAAVLVTALLALLARKATAPRGAPVLLCAVLAAKHLRFVPTLTLAAALMMAGPLGRLLPGLGPRPVRGSIETRARMRATVAGTLLAGAILACMQQARPDPDVAPEAALRAAQDASLSGPVYNSHDFGGFLILSGVKTFVDGRTGLLFLGGFFTSIMEAEGDPGDEKLLALLDRHKVEWAIVQVGEGASAKLSRAPGWREIHRDAVAAVYARNG